MTEQADRMTIQVKYKSIEKTFSGSVEDVWLSVNRFFAEFLPSFEIANKLTLNVDLQELVRDCENIIALADEGPYLMVPRNRLTDNETLALLLLASYVGYKLDKVGSDAVSKEELQLKLGKDSKITSTRLGELVKSEIAAKTADEKYKITTFGIVQIQKEMLPRIKAKIKA
ncbi:hypothetical protein COS86_04080 [Candidatus Bathyarchaeota archaeon CG07_land_8_20_14_0_80_47_9]|nr:MAG: hypothetical protein COS86_04080 [Candidatus Bathyarchaeota archaeon CG07_land_8_20_14_0_80_47_9]